MGAKLAPFYNLRKTTTFKVVRKKEKTLITNQEKQSEEHKKWVEFVQQLIEDLKSVTDEDILELLNNENISQYKEDSVYWNSFSRRLTLKPFRGETYHLGNIKCFGLFWNFKQELKVLINKRTLQLEEDFKKKLLDPKSLG